MLYQPECDLSYMSSFLRPRGVRCCRGFPRVQVPRVVLVGRPFKSDSVIVDSCHATGRLGTLPRPANIFLPTNSTWSRAAFPVFVARHHSPTQTPMRMPRGFSHSEIAPLLETRQMSG